MKYNLDVIIPFYNEINLISRAVESVFINSRCSLVGCVHVIIINDGVIDNNDIFKVLENIPNSNISVITNTCTKGPGGARNSGLDLSKGNLIAFLDADDYWLAGKIEAQISAIDSGANFIATSYEFDDSANVVTPPLAINNPIDIFLLRGIGTSTVLLSRDLVGFNRFKDIRFSQDIDFWFAIAKSPNFRYAQVPAPFVIYNTGGSTKNKWVQLRYFYKVLAINRISWITRVFILSSYIFTGVYNHYIRRLTLGEKSHEKY